MTYKCECGEKISKERVETAKARGTEPRYCSDRCLNRARMARYRLRKKEQNSNVETALPAKKRGTRYKCVCGEKIPKERIETAKARGMEPLYCSERCVNRVHMARYRSRQQQNADAEPPAKNEAKARKRF